MQTDSPCKLILQQNWVRRVELEEKSKMRFIHCHLLRDQFLMVKPALNSEHQEHQSHSTYQYHTLEITVSAVLLIVTTVAIFRQFLTEKYLFNCTTYPCYITENVKLVHWPLNRRLLHFKHHRED